MMAAHRFKDRFGGEDDAEKEKLAREVQDFKDEAERVSFSTTPSAGAEAWLRASG